MLGQQIRLFASDEDTDKYGRLLRYVNIHGKDAGLRLIKSGLAIARYDSRDGYGAHPREDDYIAADREAKDKTCAPKPTPKPHPFVGSGGDASNDCMDGYSPCLPIRADLDCGEIGHSVKVTGSDPYRLDADGDGVGCDS